MSRVDKVDLPPRYKLVGDGTVYNEIWDETLEVKGGEVEENDVEEGGIEESKIDMSEVDDSEVEGSDHFEGYE